MYFLLSIKFCLFYSVYSQSINNVRVIDHVSYFVELVQQTMYDVETKGWSNFKFLDIVHDLDTSVFTWHINGEVTYADGFIVSIGNLDLRSNTLQQIWGIDSTDNTTKVDVKGLLRLHEVAVGFDVDAKMIDGNFHFTGIYTYERIEIELMITKNMHTNVISSSASITSLSGGSRRMIYMPETKLTEFLSRHYAPSDAWDSFREWTEKIYAPTLLHIAKTKVQFPGLCYNCHW